MSDDPTPDPAPADPPALEQRVDTMETKLDRILGILDSSGDKPAPAGSSSQQHAGPEIAHEIRRQIDDRNAKEKAAADAQAHSDRVTALEQTVAGLAEKTPEQPVRRSTKWTWGT